MPRNTTPTQPDTGTEQKTHAKPVSDAPTKPTKCKAAQVKMAAGAKQLQAETVEQAKGKRKRGQPTKFTQELWEEIMDRLACCENIVDICADDKMPSYYTVRKWWRADPQLKKDVEEAWTDAAYLLHYVNDSILSGGVMSTGDFRRDEARATNNRWFMGKVHKRLFGDKPTVDLNSTVQISVPGWATAIPHVKVEQIEDGQIIDPDEVYERETVERILAIPSEPADTQTPD